MKTSDLIRKIAFAFIPVSLFLLTLGCSGGTSGTGGKEFKGTLTRSVLRSVRTDTATPLVGVTVTLGETGDSDTTDEFGTYSIRSNVTGASVEYFFESETLSTSFTLDDLPSSAATVSVDFGIDESTNQVQPTKIEIISSEGGTENTEPPSETSPSTGEENSSGEGQTGGGSGNTGSGDSSEENSDTEDSGKLPEEGEEESSKEKVTVCHQPSENSKNSQTLEVDESSLDAHLAHGDTLGTCPEESEEETSEKKPKFKK